MFFDISLEASAKFWSFISKIISPVREDKKKKEKASKL